MKFKQFIGADEKFSTLTEHIPAPLFRRSFQLSGKIKSAVLDICGLGFYDLFLNGKKITKGLLAPYISNTNDYVYYDTYDVAELLMPGENVIGVILGNGMQNNPLGHIWDFEKADFRHAPRLALCLEVDFDEGEKILIESDTQFKTSPSPILWDDYRGGEIYDARKEQKGWNKAGFDDCAWEAAIPVKTPAGEQVPCGAEPILPGGEMKPVCVTPSDEGYLYDFGVNHSGLFRLKVEGTPGQEINFACGEHLIDGKLNMRNIWFNDDPYIQRDTYICRGGGTEEYTPTFTIHGYRYIFVKGITPEQAVPELLTYIIYHSALTERGGFNCSDETVNKLQEITRRSTLSNFFYFPTDCPHREKNGWTADAALSSEHTLLNLNPENSYKEWLRNIRAAQDKNGALPGIVPTGGWGFKWGNGPAWDGICAELPWQLYKYRGDIEVIKENSHMLLSYLEYLTTRVGPDGLIAIGLGDWCQVNRNAGDPTSPQEFTDTVLSMNICEKCAIMFEAVGKPEHAVFAHSFYSRLRAAARKRLIEPGNLARGNCQTSQAMAIFYGLFDEGEKTEAFTRLLEIIRRDGEFLNVGVLGGRVLFHVLSAYGHSELAYRMITRPEFPSYGNIVARGATTLWEKFEPDDINVASLNHHFWGDISHWFLRWLAGIHYNPHGVSDELLIKPSFVQALNFAEGYHITPRGKIAVRWEREDERIILKVTVPEGIFSKCSLENGFIFEKSGKAIDSLSIGENKFVIKRV